MPISVSAVEQGVKVAEALADFAFGVDHTEFARLMYDRAPSDYTKEKFRLMQDCGLASFIGVLDDANRQKLVRAALARAGY